MAIEVIGEIRQKNNLKFPIVDSNNVKGGFYQVSSLVDRNEIPNERRKEGMICYVEETDEYYKWINNQWTIFQYYPKGMGIPILDQDDIKSLGENIPNKYVSIPQGVEGEITNNTYTTSNGSYLDILFSAIRSLQSEVARLKNSFKYGINSYNDDKTAMSESLGEIENPDEEPLWAVEEDSLSELHECTLTLNEHSNLVGSDIQINIEKDLLNIVGNAYFKDPEKGFKVQKDPKSFIFLTTSNKDIIFNLVSNVNSFQIDLNKIKCDNTTNSKYNILIIVSKKVAKGSTDIYGDDYVWIQIQDYVTDKILASGYYNKTNELSSIKYPLGNQYYIDAVYFTDVELSKFNAYTKYQDFSKEVIPTYPDDSDYKFGAAHLTIRSVKNKSILESVSEYLQNSELVWVENIKKLYIKSDNQLIEIGSNSKQNNNMTTEELIGMLKNLGIVVSTVKEGQYNLELNDLTGVTFIHQETGKKFNIEVDSEGNLRSTLQDNNTLEERLKNIKLSDINTRGFISKLLIAEHNKTVPAEETVDPASNAGLLSDRLKIGAIYAPKPGRNIYGCSHAYIELENTSESDFNLRGCTLHVAFQVNSKIEVHSIKLTGTIKAGSTYLIRGKQYANFEDNNTVLKVKTYDQEWYVNGQLIDLQKNRLNFILLYNIDTTESNVTYVKPIPGKKGKVWGMVNNNFIDYVPVRGTITDWLGGATFVITDENTTRDYILKNTFELDPAKQAFQALNENDCSRVRGKKENDFKPFYIDTPIISFPHSTGTYEVSKYTPKASFEHKNVSTDKSKLDTEKPNMVYCSFGIDMNKTRCFNWISVGAFDEYIWIRKKGSDDKWERFESYKDNSEQAKTTFTRKKQDGQFLECIYKRMQGRFPGDGSFYTAHKCILDHNAKVSVETIYEYTVGRSLIDGNPDPTHTSEVMYFTIYPENTKPRIYQITDQQGFQWMEYQTWAGSAEVMYNKIKEDLSKETFIPVIINTGDMTQNGTRVNEWIDYYQGGYCLFKEFEHMSVVGNNDLCNTDINALGTGDDLGKSNGYYHHLFQCFEVNDSRLIVNSKYIPSTYYFECKVSPTNYERIVCVNSEITFINCKEWFNLGTSNPDVIYNIYTGWTAGKDNIVESPKYITQAMDINKFTPIYDILYTWFKVSNRRIITACHEMPFTVITRANLTTNSGTAGYTEKSRSLDGKSSSLIGSHLNQITSNDTIGNYWFSRLLEYFNIKLCIGGHKHTYTCTYPVREFYFYEDGKKNSLEHGPMPMFPSLENEYSNSKNHISWEYTKTNDSLLINNNGTFNTTTKPFNSFIPNDIKFNTSRLPIVKFNGKVQKITTSEGGEAIVNNYSNEELGANSVYLPIIGDSDLINGVTYFMCQATGYKQTSNKELPGSSQAFTQLLPLTTFDGSKDGASIQQQAPMFGIVKLDTSITVQLARVMNIQAELKKPLYNNPGEFADSSKIPTIEYIDSSDSSDYIKQRYGVWGTKESNVVVL